MDRSRNGALAGGTLPWLGVSGVILVATLVLVQGPLGQLAAQYEGIGTQVAVESVQTRGESDEFVLARLDAAIQSHPPLEGLMASNQALKETLAELRAAQGQVQRKLEVLLAAAARREVIAEKSLQARGEGNASEAASSSGGAAEFVLTPEDKELEGKDLAKLAAGKALELLPHCLELREEHDAAYGDLTRMWHAWASALREVKYRRLVLRRVEEMEPERDWWRGLNFTSGAEALERLQTLEGDDRQKLESFLMKYLPNEKLYNANDGEIAQKTRSWSEEGERLLEVRTSSRDKQQEAVDKLEEKLGGLCGIQVPLANWTEVNDALCANLTSWSKQLHYAGYSDCLDWPGVDPGYRERVGIAAPLPLWKEDPKLYVNPTVNVTFILQYFRQAEMIQTIVDRLYKCTQGKLGRGQFPGVTTTLLVNVDQAEEFQTWYQEWQRTDEGSFLVPVFSHNVHENRGFNSLANAARGEFLVFMQDNDVPPEDCQWLEQALKVFHAWPRMGAIGLRNEQVSGHKFDRAQVLGDLHIQGSKEYSPKKLVDPETNVRMHFASVADVGPLAVRKELFHALGGFHEGFCKRGNPCSLADWQLTLRVWLAGYQVAHVELDEALSFHAAPNPAAQGAREMATALQNVKVNFEALAEIYEDYRDFVVKEVKRMNSHLPEVK